jgi:hypothetical protein
LNDADRRAANTLAVYVDEGGSRYIKHYLIDMGSTLGSNNKFPHAPKYGNEYLVDPRSIAWSIFMLGTYVKPWEFETGHRNPVYPSVGYFESEIFDPARWVPTYPNPAFEKMTLRDAFWGAKIVCSFSDSDLAAIVKTARMSDPAAEAYLLETLIERRDIVGGYWFSRINPLDRFRFDRDDHGDLHLLFDDLALEGGLVSPAISRYWFEIIDERTNRTLADGIVNDPRIPIADPKEHLVPLEARTELPRVARVEIETTRNGDPVGRPIEVHFVYPGGRSNPRVIGIHREE